MTTRHLIPTSVLVAIGLAASGSSALARPYDLNANRSNVPAGSPSRLQGGSYKGLILPVRPVTEASRITKLQKTQATAPGQPTVVHVSAPANGFDWGDAGIGVAGGVALTMLGVGGGLVASGRRSRRTHGTPVATG